MKRYKTHLLYIILFTIVLSSCKDSDELENLNEKSTVVLTEAQISGPDFRACVCCGGYLIEIDDILYRFDPSELPENDIDLSLNSFPIDVMIDWESVPFNGCDDFILIISIEEI